MTKKKTTFNISKSEKFSEWYSEILNKAEVTDLRYGVKGFIVIRPWGAKIMEKMYRIYESALRKTGHDPAIFPVVIPEENFKKESSHVKGFTPEVFWLDKKQGDDKLALRPTSETAFYEMYNLWIRSYRDLPLKIYQRANVFRSETKATRPLIRDREFHWIEAHDAFATKKEAEEQVQEDIRMTEAIMHQIFGVPFLPMKRPEWDKFPGAEYTVGSDSILPDGKIIQQPSTHLLGQHFSKAFDVKFVNEKEKEEYVWQTCYGPCMSRIMASVISTHGDDNGLILPYSLSPIHAVIVPFYSKNEKKVDKIVEEVRNNLSEENIDVEIDNSDKRPGEKFFFWEMKGVPFRIEIGEKEIKSGKAMVFVRDTKEKISISLDSLAEELKNLGAEYDMRLVSRADAFFKARVTNCKDKESIKKALDSGKIARFSFCSADKEGAECAAYIEKELQARVMGTMADKKEKASGKCHFCDKKAGAVVYAGKSY
jgi:prolyl-tRNA synthetase